MSLLSRVKQKIFGETASSSEMGKIGSDAAGSPATTKDLALIQSLSQYAAGLYAITASAGQPPRIQDINSLFFLVSSQIAYNFQAGIPEWESATEYYANISFVTKGGIIYKSLTGSGGSPNVGNDPTSDVVNWVPDDAIVEKVRALAAEALLAPKANPTFTGHVTVPDGTNTQDAVSKAQLDAEASTRATADSTETTNRQNADTALQSNIDALPIKSVGIAALGVASGSYNLPNIPVGTFAPISINFVKGSTSISAPTTTGTYTLFVVLTNGTEVEMRSGTYSQSQLIDTPGFPGPGVGSCSGYYFRLT